VVLCLGGGGEGCGEEQLPFGSAPRENLVTAAPLSPLPESGLTSIPQSVVVDLPDRTVVSDWRPAGSRFLLLQPVGLFSVVFIPVAPLISFWIPSVDVISDVQITKSFDWSYAEECHIRISSSSFTLKSMWCGGKEGFGPVVQAAFTMFTCLWQCWSWYVKLVYYRCL
jgi:hypothetical protein